ncbi:MAG: hypothetical protein FWC26_09245 [Fibromonadales bacterium]|nr:hypothetical protein [Fibromonadales bacterium]
MTEAEKQHAQWLKEYEANLTLLEELRKIQIAEYKRDKNYDWEKAIKKNRWPWETKGRIKEKVSAMGMAKLEELISLEYNKAYHHATVKNPCIDDDEFGTHLIYRLLWERKHKNPHPYDFKMTDKKYKKFIQINNAFMETYKLAKAEAKAIETTLKKCGKSNFRIDIILKPVFFYWDKLYDRRRDSEWLRKNKDLEIKYNLYEALEWAFERYCLWQLECDQRGSFCFEHDDKNEWWEKDPDGNLGPTNWACEWISRDTKYYWMHRFCYVMHILGVHTDIMSLDDILEIKYLDVEFKINMGLSSLKKRG